MGDQAAAQTHALETLDFEGKGCSEIFETQLTCKDIEFEKALEILPMQAARFYGREFHTWVVKNTTSLIGIGKKYPSLIGKTIPPPYFNDIHCNHTIRG